MPCYYLRHCPASPQVPLTCSETSLNVGPIRSISDGSLHHESAADLLHIPERLASASKCAVPDQKRFGKAELDHVNSDKSTLCQLWFYFFKSQTTCQDKTDLSLVTVWTQQMREHFSIKKQSRNLSYRHYSKVKFFSLHNCEESGIRGPAQP